VAKCCGKGGHGTPSIAARTGYRALHWFDSSVYKIYLRHNLGCTIFNNELYAAGGNIGTFFGDPINNE